MKNIEENLLNFKTDLLQSPIENIFRKYIVDDECYILDKTKQVELKSTIKDKYDIQYNNIIIVGSGKLGFSIKPSKRFVPFGDESDIDIAIISPVLFEKYWQRVLKYIEDNSFYENYPKFCKKLSQNGWIRPDYLPSIDLKNEWFDYFTALTESQKYGSYSITAGLYYNYWCLENYQLSCIKQCREVIKNENSSN